MLPPKLSIIVIFHRMSRQAENTLYSLSANFQENVSESDYEIIAVENDSDDELGRDRALVQGGNIRYFRREEAGVSPVPALNFAFEQSQAPFIGLIIDGARMVTPRVVEHALLATKLYEHPLVVVPGYHLGSREQHEHKSAGYDEEIEKKLLEQIDWKNNGYDLFTIACFSGANPVGFFSKFLESNCVFCTRQSFERIGRADSRFTLPGGGSVNIYIYHALARLPESRLVVLAGEGSFHQFHGGVTTAEVENREEMLETHRVNLREVFGGPFQGMHREPLILGVLPAQAQPFIKISADSAVEAHAYHRATGIPQWDRTENESS